MATHASWFDLEVRYRTNRLKPVANQNMKARNINILRIR